MKLSFLFLVMDLLTLLAYPIVFVHGRLHQYLKTANFLVSISVAQER